MSPIKSSDAVLCSSGAQKRVMKRLLSAASASISDSLGVALPYRGQIEQLALGLESESECQETADDVRRRLNLPDDKLVFLCVGRMSPFDKMDLHPLLLALNDLQEGKGVSDFSPRDSRKW